MYPGAAWCPSTRRARLEVLEGGRRRRYRWDVARMLLGMVLALVLFWGAVAYFAEQAIAAPARVTWVCRVTGYQVVFDHGRSSVTTVERCTPIRHRRRRRR